MLLKIVLKCQNGPTSLNPRFYFMKIKKAHPRTLLEGLCKRVEHSCERKKTESLINHDAF